MVAERRRGGQGARVAAGPSGGWHGGGPASCCGAIGAEASGGCLMGPARLHKDACMGA